MYRASPFKISFRSPVAFAFLFLAVGASPIVAQEVDVYFITGQSNGINFAKEAATGSTDVGFTLHFARTSDIFNDFPNHTGVANSFSSNSLNVSLATSILASGLQQGDHDVAIFAFARNGAGLHLNTGPDSNPWIWYPGADPAAGDFYDDSLYANAITWNETRMTELTNAGFTPVVKGMFWFQGEKDGRLADHGVYGDNFENLVARFRQDYGENLPVVVTQIREVTDTAANRAVINATLRQVADDDLLVDYVETEDLEFRSSTDVHLTSAGHASLAPRWSDAMLALQANAVPVVNEVELNAGETQRSAVESMTISIAGDVTLAAGAVNVVQRSTQTTETFEAVATNVSQQLVDNQTVVTVQFDSHVRNADGALVDGNYQLTLTGSLVTRGGFPMPEDFVFGDEEADSFFSFYSDTDGNRTSNIFDLLAFRQGYRSVSGSAAYQFYLDFDTNGTINIFDLLAFRTRYLTSMPFEFSSSISSRQNLKSSSTTGTRRR